MDLLTNAKRKLSEYYIFEKAINFYWKTFLENYITSKPYSEYSLSISFGKIPTSYKDLLELKKTIQILKNNSNERNSYWLEEQTISTKVSNFQTVPKQVVFKSEKSFLTFLDKEEEALSAKKNFEYIKENLPQLENWIKTKLSILVEIQNESDWKSIIKVTKYFLEEHIPNLYYIRELPIEVHCKFIEENEKYLKLILNVLLPEEKINPKGTNFAERYFCKMSEDWVLIKILDDSIKKTYSIPFTEFSIPLSEFVNLDFQNIQIILTENKTNFYLFHKNISLPKTVVVFGSGFAVLDLKESEDNEKKPILWLKNNPIYYWGDMDTSGLEILSNFRKIYPHTKSLFMDKFTFETFKNIAVTPKKPQRPTKAELLTETETELYEFLKLHNLRLEQEKIPFHFIMENLLK